MSTSRALIIVGSVFLYCSSSVFAQVAPSDPAAKVLRSNENYRIGPGDVLDVVVGQNPTLSRTGVRVSQSGMIQIAMVDADVMAACMTERELADQIKERYKKYLVEPYVIVAVKEFNSNPVAFIGAVNSPGRFQLQRPIRLLELLTYVNGPSPNAGRTVEILRNQSIQYCIGSRLVMPTEGGDELISLDLADTMKGGERANPFIRAGDIVRVTDATQMNAYIQGNVKNGMTINLKEPVSLTQAVAMAGGLTNGAQTEKVKIRRQMQGSLNRDEMIINLKEINLGKRDDILLQPNDIVEVPGPTGMTKVFQDLYRTMIPMITQLPMRVVY